MPKKKTKTEKYLADVFQLIEELDRLEEQQRQLHLRDRTVLEDYQRQVDAIRERIKKLDP